MIYLFAYIGCIVGANAMIQAFGIWPIGFGLAAPAGVYLAGLTFTVRDLLQERLGKVWTLAAIGAGAVLSLAVSDPFVALASASAFLVSELADFAVYTPLRRRGLIPAVVASNVVGMAIDSVLFLGIAFGSVEYLPGLMVGKLYTLLPAVALVWWLRQQRRLRLVTA